METPTERELIARVKASDKEAFRILFERCQPILFRHLSFRLRGLREESDEMAHDIVQETFVRIWEHRSSLKPQLSFLAYAFRIGGNLVLDAAKRRNIHERLRAEVPSPSRSEGDDPEETLEVRMLEERLERIMREDLPDRCRTVFLLSRIEGKSHQEIAALVGLRPKTVENHVNHALKIMRKKLRELED